MWDGWIVWLVTAVRKRGERSRGNVKEGVVRGHTRGRGIEAGRGTGAGR